MNDHKNYSLSLTIIVAYCKLEASFIGSGFLLGAPLANFKISCKL